MLKKVIKMNPEMAKAHKDLGIIYLNKRLFDYAEDEFKTALKFSLVRSSTYSLMAASNLSFVISMVTLLSI